jgi:Xaa-Pro aminopeptidase
MAAEHLEYWFSTSAPQLQYFVGYTGSNGLLLLSRKSAEFFTDGRYREQAKKEVQGAKIEIVPGDLIANLPKIPALDNGRPRVGVETALITEKTGKRLRDLLPRALFVTLDDFVSPLMQIKDAGEVASIRRAAKIAEGALAGTLPLIKPGVRERDLAAELEYRMTKAGSERPAFESIVASGYRSALPHGRASDKRVQKGDFITFDFGATIDGYVSDITRTVVVGKATARQKKVYNLVFKSHQAAIAKARPGVKCADLDKIARGIISRAGYAKEFDHSLGHGIGLVIHEAPALSSRSQAVLRSGMVVTIEPGIYITGWGGVRIEDDILIRPGKAQIITTFERHLLEL